MAALCRPCPSPSSSCSCSYALPPRISPIAIAIASPSFHFPLLASSRPCPSPLSTTPASSSSSFSSSTQNEELSPHEQELLHHNLFDDPWPSPKENLFFPPHSQTQNDAWYRRQIEDEEWFRKEEEIYEATLAEHGDGHSQAQDDAWYRRQAEDEEWFRKEEEIYEARLAERASRQARPQVDPDYLSLSDSALFAQCRMDTFRASGPGGQHRNKTDSGVRLTHIPTNLVTQAVDDRSQHKNRATAMSRLRLLIAAKVRRPVKLRGYKPPLEVECLLPIEGGKKGRAAKIGINHPDYSKGVQSLLDLLSAVDGFVFFAAGILRVSPGAFSKILASDKIILQATNELLLSKGHKPFK